MWKGSAFNCRSSSDGITLLHSRYNLSGGTDDECNNGAIVGQSLRVEDNYYTSQLSVTITPDMTGRSITCIHDNGTATDIIGWQTITTGIFSIESILHHKLDHKLLLLHIWTPASLPSPERIHVIHKLSHQLTFCWDPVAANCSSVHYSVCLLYTSDAADE